MNFPAKEDIELLHKVSIELDDAISKTITATLAKYKNNNEPAYVAALVNSLSYNLGLAIAELAIVTNATPVTLIKKMRHNRADINFYKDDEDHDVVLDFESKKLRHLNFAELRVYFTKKDWETDKHGYIYSGSCLA